jgi:hypothetical protein
VAALATICSEEHDMTTISVPSSVAEILRRTKLPARLIDEQGNELGSFSPPPPVDDGLSPEQLAEMKRRMKSPGPQFSTQQMLEYIDSREKK